MKQIKASDGKKFAHLLGKNTIEIKRQRQHFIITGHDFRIIGTAPNDNEKIYLNVENGVLMEDGLNITEILEPGQEEQKPTETKEQEGEEKPVETEAEAAKISNEEQVE